MGNIYVTGANGFIGKHLMEALPDAVPVIPGGAYCRSSDDTVIHLANRIPRTFGEYLDNIRSTGGILSRSDDGGKVVYVSSSVIYMSKPSLYKASKIACEELCNCYKDKLDITIIRPYNVYGPGQRNDFVIPTIINQVLSGATIIKVQNPNARRTFVYVDDVVDEIIEGRGGVQDIGYYNHSISEIVKMVADVTGIPLKIEAIDKHADLDDGPCCESGGIISMHEGLKQTIKYFEEHKKEEKFTL
jgi:nucleoside-diphosphate-sugar epimerase